MAALSDFFDGMHGVIFPFGGTAAPTGFLMCDGSAVSGTTYAALFAVIGSTFGAGDGSTTFNVPDLRGRVLAGRDNMGGTAANRLTSGGSGINGAALGAAGGEETHILTQAQMQAHSHAPSIAGYEFYIRTLGLGTGTGFQGSQGESSGATTTTDTQGGGGAHNNTQPTLVMHYIIKT